MGHWVTMVSNPQSKVLSPSKGPLLIQYINISQKSLVEGVPFYWTQTHRLMFFQSAPIPKESVKTSNSSEADQIVTVI